MFRILRGPKEFGIIYLRIGPGNTRNTMRHGEGCGTRTAEFNNTNISCVVLKEVILQIV